MKKWIRIAVGLTIIVIAAVVAIIALRPDRYHTRERREAKDRMIKEICLQVRQINPETQLEGSNWWDETFIRFANDSWIIYRSQCHKVDPKVYDIFIGRASDGNWYYSTYHFCIGMMMLQGEDQMDSLGGFASKYALERFDGTSDQALQPTWPVAATNPGD